MFTRNTNKKRPELNTQYLRTYFVFDTRAEAEYKKEFLKQASNERCTKQLIKNAHAFFVIVRSINYSRVPERAGTWRAVNVLSRRDCPQRFFSGILRTLF